MSAVQHSSISRHLIWAASIAFVAGCVGCAQEFRITPDMVEGRYNLRKLRSGPTELEAWTSGSLYSIGTWIDVGIRLINPTDHPSEKPTAPKVFVVLRSKDNQEGIAQLWESVPLEFVERKGVAGWEGLLKRAFSKARRGKSHVLEEGRYFIDVGITLDDDRCVVFVGIPVTIERFCCL